MADQNNATVVKANDIANSSIVTDIRIDKNDLLTVVLSRAEQKMQVAVQDAMNKVKALEKDQGKADAALKEAVSAVSGTHYKDAIEKFKAALALVDATATVTTTSQLKTDNQNNYTDKVAVEMRVTSTGGYNSSLCFSTTVPTTDAIKAQIAEITGIKASLQTAREEVVTWRKKLANLPALERQYKAKLVEAQLSKTEDGKDLLASLDLANFEDSIKALPGI